MKDSHLKTLYIISVAFAIFLMVVPCGLAAAVIRGVPVDTNKTSSDGFTWNATTFGGFCYPVNKHQNFVNNNAWGEHLQIDSSAGFGVSNPSEHNIEEDELIYSTKQFNCKYEIVSDLDLTGSSIPSELGNGFYYRLPFFGKPYIAVENDATQLAPLVLSQGSSDRKTLKVGESWNLGKGYNLTVNQIDTEGDKVWFSLDKNGEEIESGVVEDDGNISDKTFTARADFGDADDQLYFITYVDSVFQGSADSIAVFKYTWLIDKDNVKLIESGDEYQGFEVKEANEDGLVLKNKDPITIHLDKDIKDYFTDSWYFQTSDNNKGFGNKGYIIYPAMDATSPGSYTLRGVPADTNKTSSDGFTWNATTFGGFCYPVNKHQNFVNSNAWGEHLLIDSDAGFGVSDPSKHTIDEDELIYSTKQFNSKYKVISELNLTGSSVPSDLGSNFYWKLPWFGKPYIAVENDATQLASLVVCQGSSDKKTLKVGETWELGKGYNLTVNQIDTEGDKVWFSLDKNGEELESTVVEDDGIDADKVFIAKADFGDATDQIYFITYVDSVFQGSADSLAIFKYTWLIDKDNVMLIESGDEYQGFEVKEANEDGLVLKNKNAITLNLDKDVKNYFSDSWYFQTSDDNKGFGNKGYIIYPATDVTVSAETESNVAEAETPVETETPESTNSTSVKEKANVNLASQPTEEETESETSPGFGFFITVAGLIAGLAFRRK